MKTINEGGNVFKVDGKPVTQRINLQDIQTTINYLEKLTGLPLSDNMLGTTGKKASSGDLDLAVDQTKISKDQLIAKLKTAGIEDSDIAKSGDNVHMKTPIAGNPANGYVQTDFMFGDPTWQKFSLSASGNSQFKGLHRHIMMASIAKYKGMKWSYKNGLTDRVSGKLISKDPDQIAKILVGGSASDLENVETIVAKIKNDKDYQAMTQDARDAFERDGLTFEEHNIMARMRDRIVNQGMTVLIEGARIEHPEDLIFTQGSKGALQAITMLKQLPAKAQDITIKWDGKPAIIFGRQNGEFFLTDKAGYTAKSYNGIAKSPEELERIMNMRSGDRTDLINMYKAIWSDLESATPSGDAWFMGDLLYASTPAIKNNKITFTPNTVTYSINADSDMGKKIAQSKFGIAVHTANGTPFDNMGVFKAGAIQFFGPKMQQAPKIDIPEDILNKIASNVSANAKVIDQLFDPATLRELKMADLPALMKAFANQKVREGNFNDMASQFLQFAKTKVTDAKYQRMEQYVSKNMQVVLVIFNIFNTIAVAKTQVIRALDSQGSGIQASVDGEAGHEGYVSGGLKLVDRLRFSRANFAKNV